MKTIVLTNKKESSVKLAVVVCKEKVSVKSKVKIQRSFL